jgi:hypothetical protein
VAVLVADARDGGGQRLKQRRTGIPVAQRADPLALLGQVGQVEIDGEVVRNRGGAAPGRGDGAAVRQTSVVLKLPAIGPAEMPCTASRTPDQIRASRRSSS